MVLRQGQIAQYAPVLPQLGSTRRAAELLSIKQFGNTKFGTFKTVNFLGENKLRHLLPQKIRYNGHMYCFKP
jgi:hypothetical protein